MDQMHAAGLKVILDIPGQPAPLWLHQKYPGVDIVNQHGSRLDAAERYMDNVSDPDYRRLLRRLAETMTKRYAKHPALFAIGYNNEIRQRHGVVLGGRPEALRRWLKQKYGTIDALNEAWATQRWSRRINTWDEVRLPYIDGPGPYERYLDMRRFWSDAHHRGAEGPRWRPCAASTRPTSPSISNLWDSAWRKGFDYLSTYRDYVSYGAMGFYPGDPLSPAFEATMMRAGMNAPIWFNEFTAGGTGYYGTRGRSRMWAHFGLLLGAQAVLPWTWHSHHGGEEQALFGLIDHDDRAVVEARRVRHHRQASSPSSRSWASRACTSRRWRLRMRSTTSSRPIRPRACRTASCPTSTRVITSRRTPPTGRCSATTSTWP